MSPQKMHHTRMAGGGHRSYRDYNPGVRLYLKGLKKQEEKIRIAEYYRQVKEKQEEQGLTFHPQIT